MTERMRSERETETDRQTDGDGRRDGRRDGETDGRTDGQTDRDRERERQTERQADRERHRQTDRPTDRQRTDRDTQADKQVDRLDTPAVCVCTWTEDRRTECSRAHVKTACEPQGPQVWEPDAVVVAVVPCRLLLPGICRRVRRVLNICHSSGFS